MTRPRIPTKNISRPRLSLITDTREPQALLLQLEAEGFDVARETLVTGDFLWVTQHFKVVCVERKTVGDLLSSMTGKQQDGNSRAVNQFTRLREYPYPVLLLEGSMTMNPGGRVIADGRTTGWAWDAVDNFLLTVQQSGIVVARCKKGAVPQRLRALRTYFDKEHHLLPTVGQGMDNAGPEE